MTSQKTKRLVETALLFAIAMILSFIKLWDMPWGGSVTLCSTLPIILIGYRYGMRWGFFSAFVFSILQLFTGMSGLKGLNGLTLVGSLILDYLLAFTVLGLGGLFRNRFKKPAAALCVGATVAILARYLCSFLSGVLLWGSYAEGTLQSLGGALADSVLNTFHGVGLIVVYSALYNAAYILPELILTLIVAAILSAVPQIRQKFD